MGLAASQARFLGLTARKANCEFKSTSLAEEKLSLSNQLSQISTEYSNAMNATKLVWQNDTVSGEYTFSYGLLMTPTALNDYTPYMLTSQSGAIILDSAYAAAARAAGISMSGGAPSQSGRDKFIEALAGSGYITMETAKKITIEPDAAEYVNNILEVDETKDSQYIKWDPTAGLGAEVVDKNVVDGMNISDIMASESMGQKPIGWAEIFATMYAQLSSEEYRVELSNYNNSNYDKEAFKIVYPDSKKDGDTYNMITKEEYDAQISAYDTSIQAQQAIIDNPASTNEAKAAAREEKAELENKKAALQRMYENYCGSVMGDNFSFNNDPKKLSTTGFSLVKNGSVVSNMNDILNMLNADLISNDFVLVLTKPVKGKPESEYSGETDEAFAQRALKAKNDYINTVLKLMKSVFVAFGLGDDKHLTGLNVDDTSHEALNYAYDMIRNVFLRPSNMIDSQRAYNGSGRFDSLIKDLTSNSDPLKDAAVNCAEQSNRITFDEDYYAVDLSNIMSAFLTYFDNYIATSTGTPTNFCVSKTTENSAYVTESTAYTFYAHGSDKVLSLEQKIADFYDELYNNICARGWRQDDTISDNEYLEAAVRDGRYNLSALHDDGYFYQTNYANMGDYLVEVTDDDAIARAEAEYTRKKAEITFKENAIDIKSKQMDAEIAELNTEIESVKKMISDSAQIFNIFQSS